MKKHFLLLPLLALTVGLSCACGDKDDNETPAKVDIPAFATGADISWASEMEKNGKTFKTRAGEKADLLTVLKDTGVDAIRLRVWVDPDGGWSGKDDVVAMARRVTAAGLPLMVDFHYSDFFADPGNQTVPAAWKGDTGDIAKMSAHVQEHTADVLNALRKAGVSPAWIQIGNETRTGMLWPTGQLKNYSDAEWEAFARLYRTGYAAAKEVFPDAKVMPHINQGYRDNAWWFEKLKSCGARFDMIALSHYPQTDNGSMSWSDLNAEAVKQINALGAKFGVPVVVSEIGVKSETPSLGKEIIADFITKVNRSRCAGLFYWEPEVYGWWKPAVYTKKGWNAYDMGAFTSDGRPSAILEPFLSK